jgi:hypothetical protein
MFMLSTAAARFGEDLRQLKEHAQLDVRPPLKAAAGMTPSTNIAALCGASQKQPGRATLCRTSSTPAHCSTLAGHIGGLSRMSCVETRGKWVQATINRSTKCTRAPQELKSRAAGEPRCAAPLLLTVLRTPARAHAGSAAPTEPAAWRECVSWRHRAPRPRCAAPEARPAVLAADGWCCQARLRPPSALESAARLRGPGAWSLGVCTARMPAPARAT